MRAVIGDLARSQNGVIATRQLLDAGLTPAAVRAMVKRGALIRLLHGVYAVADPALLPLAQESAVLLSLGDAVLSHRSAGSIWGMATPDPHTIDVIAPGPRKRPRAGIRQHSVSHLSPADIRLHSNLRLTAPARTLIDLASVVAPHELEQAFGEARAKRLLTDSALRDALARTPHNHPGAAVVRRTLAEDPGSTYTRSKAESLLRRLLKQAELPQPLVNHRLHGFTVDFLWPQHRLILEVDGYGTHGERLAFERDRQRDQVLAAAGYTVIRVTWRQLCGQPMAVVARLAQALALRAA